MKRASSLITGCIILTLLLLALTVPAMAASPRNFVNAQVSPVIKAGDPLVVTGSVSGYTIPKSVQIWFFDTDYATMTVAVVNPDNSFSAKIPTDGLKSTTYYIIVDNPSDDQKFALTMNNTIGDVINTATNGKIFTFKGTNALKGVQAASAITQTLGSNNVDDVYTQLNTLISGSAPPKVNVSATVAPVGNATNVTNATPVTPVATLANVTAAKTPAVNATAAAPTTPAPTTAPPTTAAPPKTTAPPTTVPATPLPVFPVLIGLGAAVIAIQLARRN
jgi:hypothetical protein